MEVTNISLTERHAMAEACESAAALASPGSGDAQLLADAAKVFLPGSAEPGASHYYVEMAHACRRAASGTRGITEAIAKRAKFLTDAARLLEAHAAASPNAPDSKADNITGAPTEQEREEWINAICGAAKGYTSSSNMHRGLIRGIDALKRPADSFELSLDELADAASACDKAGSTLQVTADTTPLRLCAVRVEKAAAWIGRLTAARACHLAAKSSEQRGQHNLAKQLIAAKELLNGTACPAHYNAESLKHAAAFAAKAAKNVTDTLLATHLTAAETLLHKLADDASARGHERLGPAPNPAAPAPPAACPAEPRKPLPPLSLHISSAPEGGWVAFDGLTPQYQQTQPLAAFTSAADLLHWLAARLARHENPPVIAQEAAANA